MSLSSALSVALTGLNTSTALMQLTAANISNAHTPGYTAKTANVTSTVIGDQGGVQIASYARSTNSVLYTSLNAATGNASYLNTQDTYLKQVQTILDSSSANPALSEAAAQFSAAWTQLQAAPEDATIQAAVVSAGNTFAKQINTIAASAASFKAQVTIDTTNTVKQLNTELQTVASLNQQIFIARGNNQPTGNLEDLRDAAVTRISAMTNVTVFERNLGAIALYTPNGSVLLDGIPQTLTYNGVTITNSGGQDITDDLTGGSLQAQLSFNATDTPPSALPGVNTIQKLQAQLVDIVSAFTTNAAGPPQTFANAYNPASAANSDFFTATSNDPSTFAVRTALLNDPTLIPQANTANVAATFASNFNFTDANAGLSFSSGTYTGLVSTILSGFQQAANTVATQSQTAAAQQNYYQQTLTNTTGVNVDNELVNLTTLQNSYAASAHVISTIAELFNELMATL